MLQIIPVIERNIHKILADNFNLFTSYALCSNERPNEIRVESARRRATKVISQANFASQIGAIDAAEYCVLSELAEEVRDSVIALRKVYISRDSRPFGAVHDANSDVTRAVVALDRYCAHLITRYGHDTAAA